MNELEIAAEKFSILDRVPIGVCVLRSDFRVLYWNRCLENWTRLTKQQMMGNDITDYFPHLREPKYASRLQHIFTGGPPTIFSSQLHKHIIPAPLPNGDLRIQHTTVTAEPAAEGGYYALFSIQDVTELTQRVQDYRRMRDQAIAEVKERQRTEEVLQRTNEQLQVVLDAVPGLVSWVSSDLRYIGVNHHLCKVFNQPPESFIGQELGFLESSFGFGEFMRYFLHSQKNFATQVVDVKINGDLRNFLIATQKYKQGQAAVAVGIDITEQIQTEEKLKTSLKEKEVLLKEIHHRVKNNLQIISSLLKLQSESIKDEEVIVLLNDSYNRVRSMALIHEKLYRAEGLANVDAADYINNLAANLVRSYRIPSNKIELHLNIDILVFDIDTAIPCGLIINELISNSLKYAFPKDRSGKILIQVLAEKQSKIVLEVRDDGVGLPPGFEIEESESLGLQLVCNLTNQLDGEIEVFREGGTTFKITFPVRGNLCKHPSLSS